MILCFCCCASRSLLLGSRGRMVRLPHSLLWYCLRPVVVYAVWQNWSNSKLNRTASAQKQGFHDCAMNDWYLRFDPGEKKENAKTRRTVPAGIHMLDKKKKKKKQCVSADAFVFLRVADSASLRFSSAFSATFLTGGAAEHKASALSSCVGVCIAICLPTWSETHEQEARLDQQLAMEEYSVRRMQ